MKAKHKRVWTKFPIHVDLFSLSDFAHTKVEYSSLEDIRLVDIEYKRNGPHRVVENHLSQFNIKKYIHEYSPYDEVVIRFQNFPQDQQSGFLNFKKHRRNNLFKIFQGEQRLNPNSQVTESTEPKQHSFPKYKSKEVENNVDTLFKYTIITGENEQKLLASFEAFMKQGHTFPLSLPNTETPVKNATNLEGSTALVSPIPSLTPLATHFDLLVSEIINIDNLTPIKP